MKTSFGKAGYIWHAYAALEQSRKGEQIKCGQLKVLTHNLASCFNLTDVVNSMDKYFEDISDDTEGSGNIPITFDQYLTFLRERLFSQVEQQYCATNDKAVLHDGQQQQQQQQQQQHGKMDSFKTDSLSRIDDICWLVCAKEYCSRTDAVLSDDSVCKLWKVFNLLALVDVEDEERFRPPVAIDSEEVELLLDKIHRCIGTEYRHNVFNYDNPTSAEENDSVRPEMLSFVKLLELVEHPTHLGAVDSVIANNAILELFETSILDVLKKGYLSKKGPPMMPWKERWCVLTPSNFKYFTNADLSEMKGESVITEEWSIEVLSDKTGTKQNRFLLKTGSREFEFSAHDTRSKIEWINAFKSAIAIQSCMERSNHTQANIRQRHAERLAKRRRNMEEAQQRLEDARRMREIQEQLEARVREMEEIQRHLEMHLEKEIQARQAESISRTLQEKALREEEEKRRELERIQANLKELLESESARREELEESEREQRELLRKEQLALQELEHLRQQRNEEYVAALRQLKEAELELKEAERTKEEIRKQLAEKELERQLALEKKNKGWIRPPPDEEMGAFVLGNHRGPGFRSPVCIKLD